MPLFGRPDGRTARRTADRPGRGASVVAVAAAAFSVVLGSGIALAAS
ncbi:MULTISPECIES: hypothetical protein [unclassified Spirillospora]